MTAAEIIALARIRAEEAYDNPTWIGFINACLDDLTTVAKLLKRETVALCAVASGATSIPLTGVGANANLAAAQEILNLYVTPTTPAGPQSQYRRLPMSDFVSAGWKMNLDAIEVQGIPAVGGVAVTVATVIVDYYKKITPVTAIADIPEIPTQYHNLIVNYICAKSQQKEEELNDKNDFYAEYVRGKNDFSLDRMWEMEPSHRKYIKRARITAKVGGGTQQQQ